MVQNIGFNNNVAIQKTLNFKQKQDYQSEIRIAENPNLGGTEALAAYNSAYINKQDDKFNIPELKPLDIPFDIKSIDGEQIYDSKGVLQCVVKDKDDKKYVYKQEPDNAIYLDIYNRNDGTKEMTQYSYIDNEGHLINNVYDYYPETGRERLISRYEDGKLSEKRKSTYKPDGSFEERLFYTYDGGGYSIYSYNASDKKSIDRAYDLNKNLTIEDIYQPTDDGFKKTVTKYKNGNAVCVKNKEVNGKYNEEYQNYVNNPNLKPTPYPEFITDISNIDGNKTYYSNGELESVKTSDGILYEKSLDGKSIVIHYLDKTIYFDDIKEHGSQICSIEEEYENAKKRTTYFNEYGNQNYNVTYTEGNIEKFVHYENGKPASYKEEDISKEDTDNNLIIGIDYAPNGSALDVYKSYDEIGF